MSGFVYRWYDSSNGMYYVGSHKGTVDDGYIGGGLRFRRSYNKRPECFTREILYTGDDYRELEEFILIEIDAENNVEYYNLKNAAIGGNPGPLGIESARKKLKGRKRSEEFKRKVSNGKIRYGVYCELNNKLYKSTFEAADDLKISTSYVRSMCNDNCHNKYKLSKVKK